MSAPIFWWKTRPWIWGMRKRLAQIGTQRQITCLSLLLSWRCFWASSTKKWPVSHKLPVVREVCGEVDCWTKNKQNARSSSLDPIAFQHEKQSGWLTSGSNQMLYSKVSFLSCVRWSLGKLWNQAVFELDEKKCFCAERERHTHNQV